MKTKIIYLSCLILVGLVFSCQKDSVNPVETYPNFTQLKVGNYWIYEVFRVDTFGVATSQGTFDSCFIEKDTLINDKIYYKYNKPRAYPSAYEDRFIRDSLHYLVNHLGDILFSSQNFTDTFYTYTYFANQNDTISEVFSKMADRDLNVITPAGEFVTHSMKETSKMYPKWSSQGKIREIDTRYSENVGIVTETLPFFQGLPFYTQKQLVRYNIN